MRATGHGFKVYFSVPLFFTQPILEFLVPKFVTLGLKLFDVLSLANTWQAFRV